MNTGYNEGEGEITGYRVHIAFQRTSLWMSEWKRGELTMEVNK